ERVAVDDARARGVEGANGDDEPARGDLARELVGGVVRERDDDRAALERRGDGDAAADLRVGGAAREDVRAALAAVRPRDRRHVAIAAADPRARLRARPVLLRRLVRRVVARRAEGDRAETVVAPRAARGVGHVARRRDALARAEAVAREAV